MSTVDVLDVKGKKAGSVELPAEIFGVQVNVPLMHQVVVGQLAAARQGTHSTKTRGEVRGGGRKPYRQKGTGRARQGSTRAPQFTGGGVVFGPTPRDYAQRTPKKMKAAALRAALSDRARNGRVHVLAGLVDGDTPSTKLALTAVGSLNLSGKHVLVVVPRTDELAWKSLRNVASVHLIDPGQLNTYDVLVSDDIVFTQGAFDTFVAGAPKGKSVKAVASSAEVTELLEVEEDEAEAPAKAPAKKTAAKKTEPRKPAAKKVAADADEPKKPAAKKAAAKTAEADTAEAAEPKKPAVKKAAARKAEPAERESKGDDE